MDNVERTKFIEEFVALLRFIAAGDANVGFLCKDCPVIHWTKVETGEKDGYVDGPLQEEMDEAQVIAWREEMKEEYALWEDWLNEESWRHSIII